MSKDVLSAAAALCQVLADFDPQLMSGSDCASVAELLATTEKACAGARLLAARRAVETSAHRRRGYNEGAAWLARHTGSTQNQARQALETAKDLENCPRTKAALVSGDVSIAQAEEITKAEKQTPGAEEQLLPVARKGDLSKLRDEAREHRAMGTEVHELHRAQHRARYFRHWRDQLGMVCFTGALPPETGTSFVHRLESRAERIHRQTKTEDSEPERFEAHAADALIEMTSTDGARRGGRAELVIVCDLFAWRRDHLHEGEVCHILDGGPIPVAVARELAKDAFLKAALHDGVAIHTVKHFGRHQPAELRTALDLGPVPAFSGAQCADCGSRFGLEYDHVDPVANGGRTEYSNLKARCWRDHHDKTERDRKAGLLSRKPKQRSP